MNPLRSALNKVFPSLKNQKPEFPVNSIRVLELTYNDGTKNFIPEIYEEDCFSLPFLGKFVCYDWEFYTKAVITRHFYYDENWISDYYHGKTILTKEKAVELINSVQRDKTVVKTESHIIN